MNSRADLTLETRAMRAVPALRTLTAELTGMPQTERDRLRAELRCARALLRDSLERRAAIGDEIAAALLGCWSPDEVVLADLEPYESFRVEWAS